MLEWVEGVKRRKFELPVVNALIEASERLEQKPTRRQFVARIAAGVVPTIPYLVMRRIQLKQARPAPMSAVELGSQASALTALLSVGRLADKHTTRRGMLFLHERLQAMRQMQEFKQLPEEVRAKISPSVEGFEINPLKRGRARKYAEGRGRILLPAIGEGIAYSALVHGVAGAAGHPRDARFFGGIVVSLAFLQALANQLSNKLERDHFSEENLRKELRVLHSILEPPANSKLRGAD